MTTPEYVIRGARSDADLRQILSLQAANLRAGLGPEERRAQGFVTLRHDLALLREMCGECEHVIATTGGDGVIAYALVMLTQFRWRVPELDMMFDRLNRLRYRGRPLTDWRYYVMGQVCVAKAHRGTGLLQRLYAGHRSLMSPHFDLMVTDIDRENPRSLRAHEKAGFTVIDEYRGEDGKQWLIVALDLTSADAAIAG